VSDAIAQNIADGAKTYRIGIVLGISLGALFCVAGFVLIVLGLSGSIEWVFEATNFKSKISNASPGVMLALMGMIIIWRYKPRISDKLDQRMTPIESSATSAGCKSTPETSPAQKTEPHQHISYSGER
jgi:hypothetical protein